FWVGPSRRYSGNASDPTGRPSQAFRECLGFGSAPTEAFRERLGFESDPHGGIRGMPEMVARSQRRHSRNAPREGRTPAEAVGERVRGVLGWGRGVPGMGGTGAWARPRYWGNG